MTDEITLLKVGKAKEVKRRSFKEQSDGLHRRIFFIWVLAWIPCLLVCLFASFIVSSVVYLVLFYMDIETNASLALNDGSRLWQGFQSLLLNGSIIGIIISIVIMVAISNIAPKRMLKNIKNDCMRITDGAIYDTFMGVCLAAGLKSIPNLYVTADDFPNAYTMGRRKGPIVVVTAGLLKVTSRPSLEAVLSHEVGHILNEDYSDITNLHALMNFVNRFLKGTMRMANPLNGIEMGGEGGILMFILGIVICIPAGIIWLATRPLVWFVMRSMNHSRESLADAQAVRLTRNPNAMAKALVEVHYGALQSGVDMATMQSLTSHDLLKAVGFEANGGDSTHPSFKKRINDIVKMGADSEWLLYVRK